ncbi:MAG: hypothetical protein CMC15_17350 [Flavobacteriaceae bacterium]|nr:hypothetical protein [Flavobacteriaceae bacterium]
MAEMFGTKWTNHYGDEPNTTWAVGLAGLTDKHIARGLNKVIDSGSEWPPSLPTFKAMCKAGEGWQSRQSYVPRLEYEMTEADKKEFTNNIQKLRDILNGKVGEEK